MVMGQQQLKYHEIPVIPPFPHPRSSLRVGGGSCSVYDSGAHACCPPHTPRGGKWAAPVHRLVGLAFLLACFFRMSAALQLRRRGMALVPGAGLGAGYQHNRGSRVSLSRTMLPTAAPCRRGDGCGARLFQVCSRKHASRQQQLPQAPSPGPLHACAARRRLRTPRARWPRARRPHTWTSWARCAWRASWTRSAPPRWVGGKGKEGEDSSSCNHASRDFPLGRGGALPTRRAGAAEVITRCRAGAATERGS